jgi:Tol biopolymer transport system component
VAFQSAANNLVAGDTNFDVDTFVYDQATGATTRVSVGPGGAQADLGSSEPAISADGRSVAFTSRATGLVAGDTNDAQDIFVYDLTTATTTRVSVGAGGTQADQSSDQPAISADGRWVAFTSLAGNLVTDDTNHAGDTFVHDRLTGETTRVSVGPGGVQGNDWSYWWPAISADGRRVAFQSKASNLVAGDTNDREDVFVHDRQTATTTRVNIGPGNAQAESFSEFVAISADGRRVAFQSMAANLVQGDVNGFVDVFVHDLQTGTLSRVSVGPLGVDGNSASALPALSADGRWVAFVSGASNLVTGDTNGYDDVFVRDLDSTVPVPPNGMVVEAVTGNLVTLRWTAASYGPEPTIFVIEGGANPGSIMASIPTGRTAPVFTFAAPAGSYYARVHAVNRYHKSAASNEVQFHVDVPIPPSAPANLLGLVNGSTLSLAWTNTYVGGAPTSLILDVAGSLTTAVPLGIGDSVSFAGVPPGTYTLTLRAINAGGSSGPSTAATLTVPGACSGPPLVPAELRAYREGRIVNVAWLPGASGPAPTAYVLLVTGSETVSIVTTGRAVSAAAGPGTYTLSVVAANACGASAGTPAQQVVVPPGS